MKRLVYGIKTIQMIRSYRSISKGRRRNSVGFLVRRALVVVMRGRQKGRKSCSGRGSLFIIVAREVLVDLGGRGPKFIALVLFGEAFEFWIFCDRNFWVPRFNLIGRFVRQSQTSLIMRHSRSVTPRSSPLLPLCHTLLKEDDNASFMSVLKG